MKLHNLQVNNEERTNNPQAAFIGRTDEEIEELFNQMTIIGENKEGNIQWDKVRNDVEEINVSGDETLRGVDEILRQDSAHRVHADNPIRSWVNPDVNQIKAQKEYRPNQDTILSNAQAVKSFNRVLNDQEPPMLDLQIAAEEHYLNQNSEALGDFEDIGNIKWAVLEDAGAHREERRGGEGEHLNVDTNEPYEIHGFYVEKDGKPLKPEQINSLNKEIIRRDQFNVTDPNQVPELILNHQNVEEAVEATEDYDREDFESEYQEAMQHGLITENANLTMKGWLSATNMEARDIRELEEISNGKESVDFQTEGDLGLNLDPSMLRGRAQIRASNTHIDTTYLHSSEAEGTVNLDEGDITGELNQFLDENSWIGFDPEANPNEEQIVANQIPLSEYLREYEDNIIVQKNGDKLVIEDGLEEVSWIKGPIFSDLLSSGLNPNSKVNLIEANTDYDLDVIIEQSGGEEIGKEASELSKELYRDVERKLKHALDTSKGLNFSKKPDFVGSVRITDKDMGEGGAKLGGELELEARIEKEGLIQYLIEERLNSDELERLNQKYNGSEPILNKPFVPNFNEASENLRQQVRELEDKPFIETEEVVETEADIKIDANDPIQYREALRRLENIEELEFKHSRESMPTRSASDINSEDDLDSRDYITLEVNNVDEEALKQKLIEKPFNLNDKGAVVTGGNRYIFNKETQTYTEFSLDVDKAIRMFKRNRNGTFMVSEVIKNLENHPEDFEDQEDVEEKYGFLEKTEEIKEWAEEYSFEEKLFDKDVIKEGLDLGLESSLTPEDANRADLTGCGLAKNIKNTKRKYKFSAEDIDLRKTTIHPCAIDRYEEEQLEILLDMEDEGILDLKLSYDDVNSLDESLTHRKVDDAEIENYHELSEKDKRTLDALEEDGLISLDKEYNKNYLKFSRSDLDTTEVIKAKLTGRANNGKIEVEESPVRFEGEYNAEGTIYDVNSKVKKIADNINPLNPEKTPYDQVILETDFDY